MKNPCPPLLVAIPVSLGQHNLNYAHRFAECIDKLLKQLKQDPKNTIREAKLVFTLQPTPSANTDSDVQTIRKMIR